MNIRVEEREVVRLSKRFQITEGFVRTILDDVEDHFDDGYSKLQVSNYLVYEYNVYLRTANVFIDTFMTIKKS